MKINLTFMRRGVNDKAEPLGILTTKETVAICTETKGSKIKTGEGSAEQKKKRVKNMFLEENKGLII